MDYSCAIRAGQLLCTLTPSQSLRAPVFCFSGMAPMEPVTGGQLTRCVGSYTEVTLPDLTAGQSHHLVIRYCDGFDAANRAWMPLGPYLRHGDQVIQLPPTPAGRYRPTPPKRASVDTVPIIPQPDDWTPTQGHILTTGFRFTDPALSAVAALADRQGMGFLGQTPVSIHAADIPADAYIITLEPDGIQIMAGSYGGRFYAGVTLLLMLQQGPLPCGRIADSPRFGWRGQHLDTARHYYQPTTLMALLDLMALLKLNRFHWHFADDEAFCLEIDSIPELWQKTAQRGEGQMLPGMFNGAPVEGGSYSIQTARQIIAHAKHLNIEVMPEIEAPAHALAITTLFPDTRDPDDTGQERSVQGYTGNVLNPAMPKTWEILEKLVQEVGAIFPFAHIHLGCDELPHDTWMHSPKARALMESHGLQTTHDLAGWTMARLAGLATSHNLQPAAWEEAALGNQGGIGHDAILFSWTGQGAGLEAAGAGYSIVMTPAQHVYLDMAHTDTPDDWGANWAAYVDLPDTVNWDPVPDPGLKDKILGIQGAFWSEFTTQDDQIWPMLMPRLFGVAAMCWQKDPPSMEQIKALTSWFDIDGSGRLICRPDEDQSPDGLCDPAGP